jgi:glutaredoxin
MRRLSSRGSVRSRRSASSVRSARTVLRGAACCLLLSLCAGAASASPKALAQGKELLAKDKLVDVLTLLRPDEGNVTKAEAKPAAALLSRAALKAQEEKRPELALQLAEASFDHEPAQPAMLQLLGQWALDDGRIAQARRYAELWEGIAPQDAAAKAFHEKARFASSRTGTLLSSVRGLFGSRKGKVTLYTTSWCPACKKAKAWLGEKQVEFQERDVERDPTARVDLASAAKEQGTTTRGVPVLEAYGKLAEGFSEQTYRKLLDLER